jgi:hypothetical protein
MEKGKIIIIGSGRNCDIERKIQEIMKAQHLETVIVQKPMGLGKTETNPIESIFAQARPERLVDVDWEAVKELRFNQRIQPTMNQIEYFNLVYNEPKSQFHK